MLELMIAGLLSASPGAVQLVPPLLLADFGFPEEQKAQEPEPPSGFRGDSVDRQPRVVRPADAPTLDESQWQTHSEKELQLQIDVLRERRPSLVPPLFVLGVGVTCAIAGGAVASSCKPGNGICIDSGLGGAGLMLVGATAGLIGLFWVIVDAFVRYDLDKQIESLEAELRAPERPAVISWSHGGASGLALSVPLR
jgi:hypothetical protein